VTSSWSATEVQAIVLGCVASSKQGQNGAGDAVVNLLKRNHVEVMSKLPLAIDILGDCCC
jgi:hypothetical protein